MKNRSACLRFDSDNNMKQSTKAALISAFVFPGVGHLLLKRYTSALLLIVSAMTAAYFIITQTLEKSLRLAEAIQSGNGQLDVTALTELLAQQSNASDSSTLAIATSLFFIIWLIAIIDAYRVGNNGGRK